MGPKIESMEFRPDLKPEHLEVFLDRIRPGMPSVLWDVIAPYTLIPCTWDSQSYGLAEPMDSTTGPWACQVNAPIAWHELLHDLPVELVNTRPTVAELRQAWLMLKEHSLRPSIAVNLGATDSGQWLLEVIAVVASGRIERTTSLAIADVLGGELVGILELPEAVLWRTSK
ncbi:hypothetical protein ACW9HC_31615 [Nocardia gipuzkoensis]